jgi:hypothetical protein
MRISGYFYGKRREYPSLYEARLCGSQFVCISSNEERLRYADIDSKDKLDEWVNNGLDAGIFQVLKE